VGDVELFLKEPLYRLLDFLKAFPGFRPDDNVSVQRGRMFIRIPPS
jgi:hypothetical protein